MNRETALYEARCLVEDGRPEAALVVVRAVLAFHNPYLHRPDPSLCELAELYIRVADDDPAETGVVDWAVYLHRTTRSDQTTALLTDLATQHGTAADQPAMPVRHPPCGFRAADRIAERFAVIALLHACGLHGPAHRETLAALAQWMPHHDKAPDITCTYLADAIAATDQWARPGAARALRAAYSGILPANRATGQQLPPIPLQNIKHGRRGRVRSADCDVVTGETVFPDDSWWAIREDLFEATRTRATDLWSVEVLQPWLAANPTTVRALRRMGEPDMATVALDAEDRWTLYALSRVVELLLRPWQPQPAESGGEEDSDEWLTRQAYRDFRAAVGATFPVVAAFHPFLHEIVEVEQAEDPDEQPSVVAERWPGSFIGSLVLARAGVSVRAGAHHLDARVATTSPLLWSWDRRYRPAMDLSHGWGHNSQWRTDFRRDYLLPDRLLYNADAALTAPRAQPGREVPDEIVAELVRYRSSIRVEHDPDEWWIWDCHYSEPALGTGAN
jgi:hypothetical protein